LHNFSINGAHIIKVTLSSTSLVDNIASLMTFFTVGARTGFCILYGINQEQATVARMTFLRLTNVAKEYSLGRNKIQALSDIDLEVEPGEFTAVWGPSGSGKSTLFNILATIDTPTKGSYLFGQKDTKAMSDAELTRVRQNDIGIIFQGFNLIPVLTAVENVMLPLQLSGKEPKTLKERALHLLSEVGVYDQRSQRPNQLSGGQQQRVAIARALISEPKLVLV
jgi:putative ABC transport system ATP-binding protein